jgi:hypothetical protein
VAAEEAEAAQTAGGEPAAERDQAPAEEGPVSDSEAKADEAAHEPAEEPGERSAN